MSGHKTCTTNKKTRNLPLTNFYGLFGKQIKHIIVGIKNKKHHCKYQKYYFRCTFFNKCISMKCLVKKSEIQFQREYGIKDMFEKCCVSVDFTT